MSQDPSFYEPAHLVVLVTTFTLSLSHMRFERQVKYVNRKVEFMTAAADRLQDCVINIELLLKCQSRFKVSAADH